MYDLRSFLQAFIRLSRGNHEIFFVATADKKTMQYTFELDMVEAADDFASLSGSYSMVSMGYGSMEVRVWFFG